MITQATKLQIHLNLMTQMSQY